MQLLQANSLTLHEVKQKFNLVETRDPAFFPEWQQGLPEISEAETQWLDSVREDFLDLSEYPLHEELVKMVVLSPLLSLAGFYRKPFHPVAEKSIEIELEDTDEIIRGRIDILVLQDVLWIVAVESKRWLIGAEKGLPQLLTYMMTGPDTQSPLFGMVTDGQHFEFVKLQRSSNSQYAISDEFSLRRQRNELYEVLAILKKLSHLNSIDQLM
jgi:hypothetical protein